MKWLVCFDIKDDKKRRVIAAMLEEYGIRVQRSVFEIEISRSSLKKLTEKIEKDIDRFEDSVRFYPMDSDDIKRSIVMGFGCEPFEGRDVYFF